MLFRRRRLEFLLTWIPLTGLLGALLVTVGRLRIVDVAVQAPLLSLLFVFIVRPSVYAVRALPLQRGTLVRVGTAHLASAVVAGGVWATIALLLGGSLGLVGNTLTPIGSGKEILMVFTVGVSVYLWTVTYHYLAMAVRRSREAEARAREARTLALDAELKALRAQLNPHFLFNSLNSIAALTAFDSEQARQMCVALSDFLRKSLSLGNQRCIRLSEELDLVRAYLSVEAIRFQDKMTIREAIDDDLRDVAVPPLLLQPLVENAVKHGVAQVARDGWIELSARQAPNAAVLTVSNPLAPDAPPAGGEGHGLRIVRRRLANYYGDDSNIRIWRSDGEVPAFFVELTLPGTREEISP